jgi:enamine deaminase RidA (YjgF/YER057c/UK114 family)
MTSFIVDIGKNVAAFWKVRKEVMPDASYTSATIGVAGLVDPRLLLEVQCTAVRAQGRSGPVLVDKRRRDLSSAPATW